MADSVEATRDLLSDLINGLLAAADYNQELRVLADYLERARRIGWSQGWDEGYSYAIGAESNDH